MITLSAASAHAIPLQDGTVHAVVTSPPYYSLRKYAGQQEIEWPVTSYRPMPGQQMRTIPPMTSALGLEPTPEAYIAHLVLCFREIRRVLRDDGVVWAVMGDSYNSAGGTHGGGKHCEERHGQPKQLGSVESLGPGDLMLIPHRLALALQADGWTCRNDVVWAKVAPMPESVSGWNWTRHKIKVGTQRKSSQPAVVGIGDGRRDSPGGFHNSGGTEWTDCPGCPKCSPSGYVLRRGSWRHTRAHEVVLMLTTGMGYFCDQEKVREAASEGTVHRFGTASPHRRNPSPQGLLAGSVSGESCFGVPGSGRNPRSVLTPRPESYPGAHYAVFPSTLIAPLIRASCPARCCPVCGAAWAAVVERSTPIDRPDNPNPATPYTADSGHTNATGATTLHKIVPSSVLGYRPTCTCNVSHVYGEGGRYERCLTCDGPAQFTDEAAHDICSIPGTVLDPFVGSGTVLAVARELGLNAIGLDLSPSYLDEHSKVRIGRTPSRALETLPLFQEELWRTSPHWRPRPSFLEE